MSSDEIAIRVADLGKCYQIYDQPQDRLRQALVSRLRRFLAKPIHNYYREFWALRNISFAIARGETVGIIGRNGSGKSTLLQLICGTLSPTAGEVETHGRVAALLELGAGFNPEFTGRENVLLNAAILGFRREEMLEKMDEVLAFSELGGFLDQPVKTYSSGMYSRLAFATAIHVDPEILIIDETLSVGDARFVAKCMRRIADLKERGVTILFVSHDVTSVRTLCERAIWIDQGRIVDEGDVFPVTGRYMQFIFQDDRPVDVSSLDVTCGTPAQDACPPADHPSKTDEQPSADRRSDPFSPLPLQVPRIDARPVTHWGSHRGIIECAYVGDGEGIRHEVFRWSHPIQISVHVRVPASIPRDHLSVAVSIKDLKGNDLIVSTTRDFETRQLPTVERFRAQFRFVNPLVTGRYLLVAAVENRQHKDIHYYEYLEGAHYFSSVADAHLFGLFQPPIEQAILVE